MECFEDSGAESLSVLFSRDNRSSGEDSLGSFRSRKKISGLGRLLLDLGLRDRLVRGACLGKSGGIGLRIGVLIPSAKIVFRD